MDPGLSAVLIALAGFGTALSAYLKLRLVAQQRDACIDGVERYTHKMSETEAKGVKRQVASVALKMKIGPSLRVVVKKRQAATEAILGRPPRKEDDPDAETKDDA